LTLISLEKKLMKNKALLSKISTEIETIKKQDFFDIGHSNSLARLRPFTKDSFE
jgi:high frequency lysogenization protein